MPPIRPKEPRTPIPGPLPKRPVAPEKKKLSSPAEAGTGSAAEVGPRDGREATGEDPGQHPRGAHDAPQAPSSKLRRLIGGDEPSERPPERPLLGDGALGVEVLAGESPSFVAEHLMILLSRLRANRPRAEVLTEVAELLLRFPDPHFVRRVLYAMGEVGKIVDVYPLEVLAFILERRPGWVPGIELSPFILNKTELEAAPFFIEEEIKIRIPLAMKIRAFALEGGGSPGYCFQPGPPGEYVLELADAGRFVLLLRGELRKKAAVDRVVIRVREESP